MSKFQPDALANVAWLPGAAPSRPIAERMLSQIMERDHPGRRYYVKLATTLDGKGEGLIALPAIEATR